MLKLGLDHPLACHIIVSLSMKRNLLNAEAYFIVQDVVCAHPSLAMVRSVKCLNGV